MIKSKNKNKINSLDDFSIQVTKGSKTRQKALDETANFRRIYDESDVPYMIKKDEDGEWCLYLKPDSKPGRKT